MVNYIPLIIIAAVIVIGFLINFLLRRKKKAAAPGKSFEQIRKWGDSKIIEVLTADDLASDHRINALYLLVSEHFKNLNRLKAKLSPEGFKKYEEEYLDLRTNPSKKPTVENYKKMVSLLEYEHSRK